MTLTVGTDTYISLADADAYLSAHYVSTDAKLAAWTALTDGNCEILLRKAAQIIDRAPLVGLRAVDTQAMAFPRAIYTDAYRYNRMSAGVPYGCNTYVQTSVPDEVKHAQCEIALDLASPSKRTELQRQGVKSFSLGKLSENYGAGRKGALPYEARELLAPYLIGGAPIC